MKKSNLSFSGLAKEMISLLRTLSFANKDNNLEKQYSSAMIDIVYFAEEKEIAVEYRQSSTMYWNIYKDMTVVYRTGYRDKWKDELPMARFRITWSKDEDWSIEEI